MKFQLGDKVWRVQGSFESAQGVYVHGPAMVSAVIHRAIGQDTYLLSWDNYGDGRFPIEIKDEQSGAVLYKSKGAAQRAADRWHNSHLNGQRI